MRDIVAVGTASADIVVGTASTDIVVGKASTDIVVGTASTDIVAGTASAEDTVADGTRLGGAIEMPSSSRALKTL